MDSLTVLQLAVAVAAAFAGSTVFGAVGFGFGMVYTPVLLLVLDPQTAVVTANTVTIPMFVLIMLQTRSHLKVREMMPVAVT